VLEMLTLSLKKQFSSRFVLDNIACFLYLTVPLWRRQANNQDKATEQQIR
jgi:hypothetical protein